MDIIRTALYPRTCVDEIKFLSFYTCGERWALHIVIKRKFFLHFITPHSESRSGSIIAQMPLDDAFILDNLCKYRHNSYIAKTTLRSRKSDAKIEITITMAHLIRINYPLSSFNYRLSGTNVANFNKIHHIVSEQQLFIYSLFRINCSQVMN